ncbi:hypothetical protein Fmac_032912 [Flemingia macrophylla]|uniref:Uncharacterized protein n=1 Tax=Flemingia macrophylla TaxID=520843 RepID=A0ABD1L6A5_9FABA
MMWLRDTSAKTRKLEGNLDALVNLVTFLAANRSLPLLQESATSVPPMTTIQQFSARNDVIVIRGVHDVATDTSAETRKLEGKLDAFVNLVTLLAANQKLASVARVCGIRFSNDHHTSQFNARNDATIIKGVHDAATDTSAETRILEGKLDAFVNLVTQLAANQKLAYVARVCDIRSSNDHHTSVCHSSQQSGEDEHPEAYAANTYRRPPKQGVHDVARDTSAETIKLEGKLDALVNLVTQLAANQKLPLLQESAASILPRTTILVSILHRSHLEWMTILRLMWQTPRGGHHSSRDQTLDRDNGSQLLAIQCKK